MNNNAEIAQKFDTERRESISKFIYFIFSITTVSCGYAITATQNAKPSFWLCLWGLSIVAMGMSLVFGALYIHKHAQSLSHAASLLSLDEALSTLAKQDDASLKNSILQSLSFTQKVSVSTMVSKIFDDFILKQIILKSKENLQEPAKYIECIDPRDLRNFISEKLYQFAGYNSQIDALKKTIEASEEARKYLTKQLVSLVCGYLLFVLWHFSVIFYGGN